MSEIIEFSEQLPALTESFPFPDLSQNAWEAYFDNKKFYDQQFPNLPQDTIDFFVSTYPEKVIERDVSILEKLSEVDEKLREKSHQPTLLVNEHTIPSTGGEFVALSFGLSLGPDADEHIKYTFQRSAVPSGSVRPRLFGPQTMLYYDDIGIDFTQSFGVMAFEPSPIQHIGGFLIDRTFHWQSAGEDSWRNTFQDSWGKLMIGNALIEEYISVNPDHAAVIDGCRDAYRNSGVNPELGRTIARTFGLDETLSDTEQSGLQWL